MKLRATLVFVGLVAAACAGRRDSTSDTHQKPSLTGRWELVTPASLPGRAGTRLELVLDSTRADTVYGRVTHLFSGDVGIDPAELTPIRGTWTAEGMVRLAFDWREREGPGMLLEGRQAGETIVLELVRRGADTVSSTGWRLERRRP